MTVLNWLVQCMFYAMGDSGKKGDLTVLNKELMDTLEQFSKEGVEQERLNQITGMAEADAVSLCKA